MGKDRYFTGQPIFNQLLSLLDRQQISRLARKHQSDYYYKRFKTYEHLVTMLYATFHKCTSIREVTTGMQACASRLHHVGVYYFPRRSTLSDANRDRSSEVFEAIYKDLYDTIHRSLPDSRSKPAWFKRLFVVDSTTISLFKEILKNAGRPGINGKRKGGIKVHTLMKADEDVPCLVRMTAAAKHDLPFIQGLRLSAGSIVTFDKAYNDYAQYDLWTKQKVFWVTRMRTSSKYEVTKQRSLSASERDKGVQYDAKIILGHQTHDNITRTSARLIVYKDPESGKQFKFITNHYRFLASTICSIYKQRWQIEVLFKRIKQNYPLQYFLGDNENAIRIQIWCALIADLIINYVRSKVKREWSFASLSSMIRIHLMTYIQLLKFLENPDRTLKLQMALMNRGPTLFE